MNGRNEESATALCRFCLVALCKKHLLELYGDPPTVPQYACRHRPAMAPGEMSDAHRAAIPRPAPAPTPSLAPGFGNA